MTRRRLHRSRILLLAIVLFCATTLAQSTPWVPTGKGLPGGIAGIAAIATDPIDPSTVYAVTNAGMIAKSADGAANWRTVGGMAGVLNLAIDPKTPTVLYAATAHGIVKSLDAGLTWNGANNGVTGNAWMLTIDPVTPATLYAVASGLYKSLDGGAHWTAMASGPSPGFLGSIVIDPMTQSTLYASVTNGEIWKSKDGGSTWSTIKAGLPQGIFAPRALGLAIAPADPLTVYAGSFGGGSVTGGPGFLDPGTGSISKSADGGQTWRTIRTGIPQDGFVRTLAVSPTDQLTIYATYAGSNGSGILKSSDGGESWGIVNSGSYNTSQVALAKSGEVFAGYSGDSGYGNILQSMDGGSSWSPVGAGLTFIDLRVFAADPLNPAALYVGGAGGVFKTVDLGGNWAMLGTVEIAAQPYPSGFGQNAALVRNLLVNSMDPSFLYADTTRAGGGCVFTDKLVFKSVDGGASWSDSISPSDTGCDLGSYEAYATVMAIDPKHPGTLYLGETEDEDGIYGLLKSSDGGATWITVWNYVNGLLSGLNVLAIDPVNPLNLYAGVGDATWGGAGIGVFKSVDGGLTWDSTTLDNAAVTVLTVAPDNPNVIYAVTDGIYTAPYGFRGVYESLDAGATWIAISNGLAGLAGKGATVTSLLIDRENSSVIYAGTSGDGVYISVDAGANWSHFSEGLASFDVRALTANSGAPYSIFAATSGGVYRLSPPPRTPKR